MCGKITHPWLSKQLFMPALIADCCCLLLLRKCARLLTDLANLLAALLRMLPVCSRLPCCLPAAARSLPQVLRPAGAPLAQHQPGGGHPYHAARPQVSCCCCILQPLAAITCQCTMLQTIARAAHCSTCIKVSAWCCRLCLLATVVCCCCSCFPDIV